MTLSNRAVALLLTLIVLALPAGALGEGASGDRPGAKGIPLQPMAAEGAPVALVYVHLTASTGSPEGDEALRREVATAFNQEAGGTFRQLAVEMQLKKVQGLPSLAGAEYGVYQAIPSGQVVVVIFASPKTVTGKGKQATGMLATGKAADFPVLYEDSRSKLTLILNGGAGVYSDTDPWFGGHGRAFNGRNPLSKKPAGSGNLTWGDAYVEPGVGGIVQVGDLPFYLYGTMTYTLSGTLGDDIYNGGSWGHGEFERLYAGMIYDLPGKGNVLDVSVGKQIYQLRDGFLLSKIPVSTSGGERAALYLGPRLASKNTALGRLRLGSVGVDAFMIEPSEVDIVKTGTRLVGTNLQYKLRGVETAFTFFYMADCDSTFPFRRQGLRTYNPSLWLTDVAGIDGLWFKAEYAFQDNENYAMAAHAGYAWLGYQSSLPMKPGLSYRFSIFTGDDPSTPTVERFDPLFSGGLGNFLPGLVFSKVYKNSNLQTHRVKANIFPSDSLEVILDYFRFVADTTNNRGGIGAMNTTLSSRDVGDEITLSTNYYFLKHFFLQGLASVAIPGDAVKSAVGGDVRPWYTLQASLYVFY